jgi:hypothetical protein
MKLKKSELIRGLNILVCDYKISCDYEEPMSFEGFALWLMQNDRCKGGST